MFKQTMLVATLLLSLVACGGGGGSSSNNNGGGGTQTPAPVTPVITAPSTGTRGQSYQATTQVQQGCTYTWTVTNGTINSGQSTNAINFTADVTGQLTLDCQVRNSTGAARSSVTMAISDPLPPPPTHFPGVFRNLKGAQATMVKGAAQANVSGLTMSHSRAGHTATALQDGRVVILGGDNTTEGYIYDIDIFDPVSETFTKANATLPTQVSFPDPNSGTMTYQSHRFGHSACLTDDNQVLIVGGEGPSIDVYDPVTDTVQVKMPFDPRITYSRAINIGNNRVLIYGGYTANMFFNPMVVNTRTWTFHTVSTDPLHHRIHMGILQLRDGRILISGGVGGENGANSHKLDDISTFDPATETFTTVGTLPSPRDYHTMVEYPNGKIGIFGGVGGTTRLQSVEEFDLTTGQVTHKGDLIDKKAYMLSAYLTNGYTIHVGGFDTDGFITNTQMIYDPVSAASGYTNNMLNPRQDFTMTELTNGMLLITGGYDVQGLRYNTAEVFDPQANIYVTYPYTTLPTSEKIQLTAQGATNGLVWTADSGSVDANGLYTAPDAIPGTPDHAYITATNGDGKSAIVHVNFIKTILTVTGAETPLTKNTTLPLTAHVAWYQDQSVTWTVPNGHGTIDTNGVFTPEQDFTGPVNVTCTVNANTKHTVTVTIQVVN